MAAKVNGNECVVRTDGGHEAVRDADAVKSCREEIWAAIDGGASFDDVASIIECGLGLEPDYLMDVMGL